MPEAGNAWTILWTAPAILVASMMVAWGAESAQFFMAQGVALVILAWMQTLPEFAVEASLAWEGKTHLLIAGLTGAVRLLTGLGWPMIYCAAAYAHRKKFGRPLYAFSLDGPQSLSIAGVLVCLVYVAVIAAKGSLDLPDAAVLLLIYAGYIYLLQKLPAESHEDVGSLDRIPKAIVLAPRAVRIGAILALFLAGCAIIYFVKDPFLNSMFAMSAAFGVSQFIFIQWVVPFISEFPEFVSSFYWARSIDDAPIALMNMVSSNITQWAVLSALLPVVLSISAGHPTPIVFDREQEIEILMTLGQSLMGILFLLRMRLTWWQAAAIFVLWAVQFLFSLLGQVAAAVHLWTTIAYFAWVAVELARFLVQWRKPKAIQDLQYVWMRHVAA